MDNARSIIHQNIEAVASSASSIIASKRRKEEANKTSENPLKNGGIPKKYWMNDAFVSDCLNCFRPFTAFRRKHHCRFVDKYFVQIAHCLFHITNIEMKGITPRILQNRITINSEFASLVIVM